MPHPEDEPNVTHDTAWCNSAQRNAMQSTIQDHAMPGRRVGGGRERTDPKSAQPNKSKHKTKPLPSIIARHIHKTRRRAGGLVLISPRYKPYTQVINAKYDARTPQWAPLSGIASRRSFSRPCRRTRRGPLPCDLPCVWASFWPCSMYFNMLSYTLYVFSSIFHSFSLLMWAFKSLSCLSEVRIVEVKRNLQPNLLSQFCKEERA